MNRKQLNIKMKLMHINKNAYNLYAEDGGRTDERLCLEKVSENEWHVFYLERGKRTMDVVSELLGSKSVVAWIRSAKANGSAFNSY